jgi:O-antigen ligase
MLTGKSAQATAALVGGSACVAFAFAAGIGFAHIATTDMRWAIAIIAGLVFFIIVRVVSDPQRLLWILFISSFQLQDPSVRLLYGHAGSYGILITLPTMLGVLYVIVSTLSGRLGSNGSNFRWLGPVGLPWAALMALSVVSLLHSEERFLGISNVLVQLQVYFVYVLALNCVRSEDELKLSLKVLYAALIIQCAIYFVEIALNISYISLTSGVVKSAGSDPVRPGGTLGTNPFSFTNFALPILFILFARLVRTRTGAQAPRWRSGLLLIVGMVAIGLTLTRTAYANLFLGLLCVAVLGYRRRSVSTRKVLGMLAAVTVVAIAITPLMLKRLEREPMKNSYDERAALMEMAINVIEANPGLGVGPGAYEATYKRYLTSDLEDKWQWMVHNHYLLRVAEVGLLGGVALVTFLFMAWRSSWATSASTDPTVRALALASAATVLTTAHQMYWDQWTHVPAQTLFLFLLGLTGAAQSMKRTSRAPARSVASVRSPPTFSNPMSTEVS